MRHGGQILVDQLKAQGVRRVFSVPGESFLAALDGLYESGIENVVCRHEGGACMMAEAHAKLTGQPGIVFVTRGPGATNASAGIHIAKQDSTPLIMFVGQIDNRHRDREAFQEVNYRAFFAPIAKWAAEIDQTDRIPEYISRAFHQALSGRPGPIVLALPENMLEARVDVPDIPPIAPVPASVCGEQIDAVLELLCKAKRPLVVAGGSLWSTATARNLAPSPRSLRPAGLRHLPPAGPDGQPPPALRGRPGRGDEPAPGAADARRRLPADPGRALRRHRLGRVTSASIPPRRARRSSMSTPTRMNWARSSAPTWRCLRRHRRDRPPGAARGARPSRLGRLDEGCPRRLRGLAQPRETPGALKLEQVMAWLSEHLPDDAIITNGAGNFAAWLHRYFRARAFPGHLAPTSGSMGYGVPAAVAAKLEHPDSP
jgi:acetolactate synthase I/II/III large subunit